MCGRYRLRSNETTRLAVEAGIKDFPTLLQIDRYNIAPTQFNPVVLKPTPDADPTLAAFRWGLVPPWARDLKSSYSTINARSETVATLRTFAEPFKNRHCLVPAGGWYEWRQVEKVKQPYLLTLPEEEPFFFAGLWQVWKPRDGEPINSFTILTTDANRHIRALHDRMPVIVPKKHWLDWVTAKGEEDTSSLLKKVILPHNATEVMPAIVPVSRAMSNARNEGEAAAAELEVDDSTELQSRARVLDAIDHYISVGCIPTAGDIQESSGLPTEKVNAVIEDLRSSERIVARAPTACAVGNESGWLIAGATPPDGIPPLNPL